MLRAAKLAPEAVTVLFAHVVKLGSVVPAEFRAAHEKEHVPLILLGLKTGAATQTVVAEHDRASARSTFTAHFNELCLFARRSSLAVSVSVTMTSL